jgi:hypothetical protein
MTCSRKLTDLIGRARARLIHSRLGRPARDKKGVALFIVLSAMATLAIFVGEITYTAQVNQKLAYDRLDQIKAHSLAKSGLRLALLRIRAYAELKKTLGEMNKKTGGAASAAMPKSVMEKIWNEPITIPFTGDLSGLPLGARGALEKFRKDSGMDGKLYIAVQAQSAKFNLNSTIAAFAPAASPGASPSPSPGAKGGTVTTGTGDGSGDTSSGAASGSPSPGPAFNQDEARKLLGEQIRQSLAAKFEEDEKFRDRYRNLRPEELTEEIISWSDISYNSEQVASRVTIPLKYGPFYDVSELHYLPSVDDDVFNLLESQFTTGVASAINVNTIKEPVLAALVPQMTAEERKKFFEFRDNTGPSADDAAAKSGTKDPGTDPSQDNTFKDEAAFFKYIQEKVAFFAGAGSKFDEFKNGLAQRGITITTEENNFIVRIEATINQTKRTLEAWVSVLPDKATANPKPGTTVGGTGAAGGTGGQNNNGLIPGQNGQIPDPTQERSNLKITQLRFL